jgi:hypothetical protein
MRLWQFFVRLFDQREEGSSLALFRMALGLTTLYSLVSIAGAGLVEPLWTDVSYGGMRHLGGNWLVQYFGGPSPRVVWTLWWLATVSAAAFTIGIGDRWTSRLLTLILLQSYNGLITINPLASGGYDVLMTNAFWVLVFAEPTATLSLQCRFRTGRLDSAREICAWPRYVLLVQLMLMYALTGFQKTSLIWTPAGGYEALYWVMQDPTWTRIDASYLAAWSTPLLRIGTALTWHWEQLGFLVLVWMYCRYTVDKGGRLRRWVLRRDWRIGWLLVGLLLHLNILIWMNVGPFSWVTLAFYFLLCTPDEWRRMGHALGRRYQSLRRGTVRF